MMGFKVIGSDISEKLLRFSKVNLDYYNIRDYELKVWDATKLPENMKFDAIVCDPPYGRTVKVKGDLSELYVKFMKSAYSPMKKNSRLVMICPKSLKVLKLNKWFKVDSVNEWFIHGSLTRQIIVFIKQ